MKISQSEAASFSNPIIGEMQIGKATQTKDKDNRNKNRKLTTIKNTQNTKNNYKILRKS